MPHPPRQRGASRRLDDRGPAARAYHTLEAWIRQELTEALVSLDETPEHVDLRVTIPVRLRGRGREEAEGRFIAELESEVARLREQVRLDRLGYRSGHVFCHWCSSPVCEHSGPPDSRSIFVGYAPVGQPRWREFASWMVEIRDPRLDRLFQERALPLATFCTGDSLRASLLPEYQCDGSPYRIVGQVVAGFFRVPTLRVEFERGLVLTAQLIERRLSGGEPSYSLNLISRLPAPHDLPATLAERTSPLLTAFVENLRQEVRKLQLELASARNLGRRMSIARCREVASQCLERAPALLDKLLRRTERRTRHAEKRTLDPGRPTASAHSDTLAASAENLLYDRLERTVIVRGPRNRIHVYRADGTHITSVIYPGETIRDRLRAGRWQRLDLDAVQALRSAVRERGSQLEPPAAEVTDPNA